MVMYRILKVPIFETREWGEICGRNFKYNIHSLPHLVPCERAGLPGASELIIFTVDEVYIVAEVR